jgi:hypothetical protein
MKGKIFNTQEVQAIIAGNKTQFREVIKPQPFQSNSTYQSLSVIRDCPYQVGQKIFVKERFCVPNALHQVDEEIYGIWKPASQMKQEHSRLTLQIKEIRVERLADISEEDAYKEGVQRTDEWTGCADDLDFTDAFKFSWNATHKKPEEKFEANPWVWSIQFEVAK